MLKFWLPGGQAVQKQRRIGAAVVLREMAAKMWERAQKLSRYDDDTLWPSPPSSSHFKEIARALEARARELEEEDDE